MSDKNKRNLLYFESNSMKWLYENMEEWQRTNSKHLLSTDIQQDGDKFCCIALSNHCRYCKRVFFTVYQATNADLRISIAHDRNNTKESCMKNPLSLVNGDELAEQSRSAGTGKNTKEEIDAETAGGARGCPVFMAVAE